MAEQTRPLLSISMIVKNEAERLEKTLQALQPLREAVPCELVIADTGSTDGTKEIAARYADILFDFAWIKDFAAARNASLKRCSGIWALVVDADEVLDADFQELVDFLNSPEAGQFRLASVNVRSYLAMSDKSKVSDFMAVRMVRMDSNIRFAGTIHEALTPPPNQPSPAKMLREVIFHHDGYNNEDAARMAAKNARNMELLEREARLSPYSLRRIVQCIESSPNHAVKMKYVRRGMRILQQKKNKDPQWEALLFRHAVEGARNDRNYEQMLEWIQEAEEKYNHSIFVRVDAEAAATMGSYEMGHYEEAVGHGAKWEEGLIAYDTDDYDLSESSMDVVIYHFPNTRSILRAMVFDALCRLGRPEEAALVLEKIEPEQLQGTNWAVLVNGLLDRDFPMQNAEKKLQKLWDIAEEHSANGWDPRKTALMDKMNQKFSSAPAAGTEIQKRIACLDCEPGRSARILLSHDRNEIEAELAKVERWDEVLFATYPHAIGLGIPLPPSFFHRGSEALEELATIIPDYTTDLSQIVLACGNTGETPASLIRLMWILDLTIAALRKEAWDDKGRGEALCGQFHRLIDAYLSRTYRADVFNGDNLLALPGLHRFGWYYLQACKALGAGDEVGYVRLLKEGLETAPAMKAMVGFLSKQLADRKPELLEQKETPELLALADKIRTVLAAYPVDDPAVAALKQSPAYQKVAHLIEGVKLTAPAGIVQ